MSPPSRGQVSNFASDPSTREAWPDRQAGLLARPELRESLRRIFEHPGMQEAIRTYKRLGHAAFCALVDGVNLRTGGPSSPGHPVRLRQSQTSRRSHRSNGPPSKEADLQSLRPGRRAIAIYRRMLATSDRYTSDVNDALIAADITPRSGTDLRARAEIGVTSAPDGFQGPHRLRLAAEPHPPLKTGGTVTRSKRGETRSEHLARHQAEVRYARAVLAHRARITGQVAV